MAGCASRSEEHTSELQSRFDLVCRLLLEPARTVVFTLSLHDALPISGLLAVILLRGGLGWMSRGTNWVAVVAELVVLVLVGYLANEVRQTSNGYRVVVRNFYGGLRVQIGRAHV